MSVCECVHGFQMNAIWAASDFIFVHDVVHDPEHVIVSTDLCTNVYSLKFGWKKGAVAR